MAAFLAFGLDLVLVAMLGIFGYVVIERDGNVRRPWWAPVN